MIDRFARDVVRGVDVAARSLEPSYAFAQAAYQTWEQETRFIFFSSKIEGLPSFDLSDHAGGLTGVREMKAVQQKQKSFSFSGVYVLIFCDMKKQGSGKKQCR